MGLTLNFGIDLGTTNSCIAYHNGTSVRMLTLKDGQKTLPSCVMYENGKIIVGRHAYENRHLVDQVVYSAKRDIGTDKVYHIKDGDKKFDVTPVEVSAEILKELKRQAEAEFQSSLKDIVITIPAYFNDAQKKDTAKAGKLAGFDNIRLAIEPSAAAIAYTTEATEVETVVVYDLGGGTFDVSTVTIVPAVKKHSDLGLFSKTDENEDENIATVSVISIEGNNRLGGDDFDHNLYDEIARSMTTIGRSKKYKFGKNFSFNRDVLPADKEKLICFCEQVKKHFGPTSPLIGIPVNVTFKNGSEMHESISIDEEILRRCFMPIFNETIRCFDKVLTKSGGASKIVLIGGSTKFPLVKQLLSEIYKDVPIFDGISPDYSVAIGASLIAAADKHMASINLFDVVPQYIGIKANKTEMGVVKEDIFEPIIMKNAVIPVRSYKEVKTEFPEQTTVSLEIYEGGNIHTEENSYIGSLEITDIEPKTEVQTAIVVELSVDINGLLRLKATYDGKTRNVELLNVVKSDDRDKPATEEERIARKKYIRFMRLLGEFELTEPEEEVKSVFENIGKLDTNNERYPEFLQMIKKFQKIKTDFDAASRVEFMAEMEKADEEATQSATMDETDVIVRQVVQSGETGEVISDTGYFR